MENIKNGGLEAPKPLTKEEKLQRQWKLKLREKKIALTRAGVLRKQITEAYEILENIRFDYLGDTAFRDKIVRAKKALESAYDDFLLDDSYHRRKIDELGKLTPEKYDEMLKNTPIADQNPK